MRGCRKPMRRRVSRFSYWQTYNRHEDGDHVECWKVDKNLQELQGHAVSDRVNTQADLTQFQGLRPMTYSHQDLSSGRSRPNQTSCSALQPGPSPYPSLRIGQTWRRPSGARGRETNYDRSPWSASCGSGRVHTSSPGCVSEAAPAVASNYSGHVGWPSRAAQDPRPSQSRPVPRTQRQERDIKHKRQGNLTVEKTKNERESERERVRSAKIPPGSAAARNRAACRSPASSVHLGSDVWCMKPSVVGRSSPIDQRHPCLPCKNQ